MGSPFSISCRFRFRPLLASKKIPKPLRIAHEKCTTNPLPPSADTVQDSGSNENNNNDINKAQFFSCSAGKDSAATTALLRFVLGIRIGVGGPPGRWLRVREFMVQVLGLQVLGYDGFRAFDRHSSKYWPLGDGVCMRGARLALKFRECFLAFEDLV